MKTHSTITALLILLLSLRGFGQGVSKDSLQSLKDQKQNIELSKKVNDRKIELAKLENDFAEKTKEVEKTTTEAQNAANENQELADKLKSDPQNKDLGNQANKAARKAERSAKSARKANEDLEKIKKNIEELKSKISEDEAKLGSSSAGISSSVSAVQNSSNKISEPNTTSPAVTRNVNTDSAVVKGNPQPVTERIVESTYKNYPQQQGQPTIIINNIIVPSDYNQPKQAPAQEMNRSQNNRSDRSDYDDFKAWQRQRDKGNTSAGQNNISRSDSGSDVATTQDIAELEERLTFRERFGERQPRNSGLWVIPVVGIHASNFNADIKQGEADGRIGWNAGLDFRMHAKRFFFQPGAHYFSSSLQVTSEDSIASAPLLDGPRIHSLKVPVLLGLYLTRANKGFFKMNVKAGATGTYVLAVDKNTIAQFNKDNINDFSYGLNAGIGLEFGFLTLDITHEWGMSALFKENNIKNNVLRATIGFKL